jgi:hypothetical protein
MAKIQNEAKWGRATAKERYSHVSGGQRPNQNFVDGLQGDTAKLKSDGGEGDKSGQGLINQKLVSQLDRAYQKPQGREDRQAVNYENDADGWVRGMGKDSPYPHFDHTKKGK